MGRQFKDFDFWEKLGASALIATLVFVLSLIGYVLAHTIDANGKSDYCYIERTTSNEDDGQSHIVRITEYVLLAHIPWRTDRKIMGYKTVEDAKHAADLIECPIK